MNETYLSISQVNNYIKNIFEAEVMLQNICVFGEVSSYKISNNIAYFNLQDENGILPCVLFSASRFITPNIGDMVLVVGSINYYAKGGKLSFNAVQIAPYGKGILYENFLKLKTELENKGYFSLERKKPLPERVKRIGVVTSSTGAVIQDIIDITKRRNKAVDIVIYPVKVQGVGAEFEIANGINFFSLYENIDVVIVARGGGSMEDMQPFNTLIVADATFNCKKPIVSAVGHETDFTIIDFVSDLRAPTPSAAAELVVNKMEDDINKIDLCATILRDFVLNKIYYLENKIDVNYNKINILSNNKFLQLQLKFKNAVNNLQYEINNKLLKMVHNVEILHEKIKSLDPMKPINQGYVKVEQNNSVINSCRKIEKDKIYNLVFADGKAEVKGV